MRTPIPITRSHLILNTQAPPRKHCCKALGVGYQPFPLLSISSTTLRALRALQHLTQGPAFTGSIICLDPTVRKRCPSLEGLLVLLFSLSFFTFSLTEPVQPEQPQDGSPSFPQGPKSSPTARASKDSGGHSYWSFCCSFLSLLFKARPEMPGAYL